ncbi:MULTISPECIES: histidine phosphatase family protein [Paenibacillus]|uniref:histidine phosphatase family protein n=1 Tax=Paenibacillus TaxID=44249 RepID=UPI001B0E64FD|nr:MULTISPECIES: histidine phosphatase family protein [Paenibacillus]WFB59509.1 histidine phosphatase family protein [Paenibacillus sp. BR1-192]GIP06248.1 phosphoglycerate mutase [Paenibacillus lautus]
MAIYFVRHGQDEEGYRGGWSQRGLTDEGIRQAEKLGQYLNEHKHEFNIRRIICSDLQRACQTAAIIADKLSLPLIGSEEWRETNNGLLAGMPHALAEEKFPGLYFSSLRMDEKYPGGESPLENFQRIKDTFTKLCQDQESADHHENVLVVTHGGVINIIYHLIKDTAWTNKNPFFPAANTGLHRIEYRDGRWELTIENATPHL